MVGTFLCAVVPSPSPPHVLLPAGGSGETCVRTTKGSEILVPHMTQRTLTPAVCSAAHSQAASVEPPNADQRPLQAAADNGGHVFVCGGAIAQPAPRVASCRRIRRDMRQNYKRFRYTCATHDTAHAYPSSMQCRPQSGRKWRPPQQLAASTAGHRSQRWARVSVRRYRRPAGQRRCFLQEVPERHASELQKVPRYVCHT
jgi:hypothetical protein